jgi:2-polyprenyl-6-methoxyphenol hydroxylase-like FAD-dependent oxidoreductase
MDTPGTDTDVLVVGAGPVGLLLAAELALAGVRTVVVERLAEPDVTQKARGVGVLASEALRRRGLGTLLHMTHQAGRADYRHDMGSDLAHFAWIHKLDRSAVREPGRTPSLIWQPQLEQLLADHVTALGVKVHRAHTVVKVDQHAEHVVTVLETPDGDREFTASYVVGCDGGRSSIRKLSGFEFPGLDAKAIGRIARLELADPAAFPMPVRGPQGSLQHGGLRDGWVRVRLSEPTDHPERGDREPVTVEEVHDALQRVTGVDVAITSMRDARRSFDNSRQAATYRLGRVLLAGDAAHVHSPLGGQGLNLGMMDATNLGWKLAAAVRGDAHGDQLLDTYTTERHPVGAGVLHNTRAQDALLGITPQMLALRDIVTELLDIREVKIYFNEKLSGLGIRYELPYPATDHRLLGGHVPDFVVDDTTLYTLASDGRPILLHTAVERGVAEVAGPWADRVHIRSALVLGRADLTAALIRPDGVLAWAAAVDAPANAESLRAALQTWFGPPGHPVS